MSRPELKSVVFKTTNELAVGDIVSVYDGYEPPPSTLQLTDHLLTFECVIIVVAIGSARGTSPWDSLPCHCFCFFNGKSHYGVVNLFPDLVYPVLNEPWNAEAT